MTPLTPAAVMDEQRLQEIMGYSYETDWVRDCIEALIAEVRRLQQQSQEMAHELTQTARASQHFEQQVTALIAERDAARAERDALFNSAWALLNDEPQANGEYVHAVTCSADRKKPIGCGGCSCQLGRRIKLLASALTEARRVLREVLKAHSNMGVTVDWLHAQIAAVLAQEEK